jgi:hypothetical protein
MRATIVLLLTLCRTSYGQESKSLADLARESLRGIKTFGVYEDYVDLPEPLKSAKPSLAKDVRDRLAANPALKAAAANLQTKKPPFASLWITVRSQCTDASEAIFQLQPFKLPPDYVTPDGHIYTQGTTEQQIYIESYRAYSLARASAAGETLIPPACAIAVAVSFEQYVLSSPKRLSFPARTWTRQETLIEMEPQVVSKTRDTLSALLDAFIEDYIRANPL